MTTSTASRVVLEYALEALGKDATRDDRMRAQFMAKRAIAGEGFTLWRFTDRGDGAPRVAAVFANRSNCEAEMMGTAWATIEATRGRSLAEACKVHGFDIVDVPAYDCPADAIRAATIEECAVAAEAQDRTGREWVRDSLWDSILKRAGANVRALAVKPAATTLP